MPPKDTSHFVNVDQLQPGIYIYLDLHWVDHPFGFNSFKIKSQNQIQTLKQLKLTKVRYDPDKSDAQPLPKALQDTSSNPPAESDPFSQEEKQAIQAKHARIERLKQQREIFALVEKQFIKAAGTAKKVTNNLLVRTQESIDEANQLVQQMMDIFLSDRDVAIHVMNDKIGMEETYVHALNVTVLSLIVAKDMKLSPEEIKLLGLGALFHDIGKKEIPSQVVLKIDPLTKAEREFLRMHCEYGVNIAKKVGFPPPVMEIIYQHHECHDGSGYPRGLRGDQISTLSQIVAIVNAYDNLCNHTDIANSLTPHEALSLMFAQQRAKFAPVPLNVFIHSLGVYPPGTVVKLSNEVLAIVTSVNASRPLKPIVLIYDPQIPKSEAMLIDLEMEPDINISKAMRPAQLPREVYDYLSPRKRITYYFDSPQTSSKAPFKQ
ncbi:MAG: HD-GYP domain-containing protein [Sulfuricella sp.]|nr:HD-GYP domain-containing protein [Sulfuricella sp.]